MKQNDFSIYTLPNGIRCIHRRVRSAVTHCALTINAGSRDELPAEHGAAHLVEHCIFKGTERRRAFHINSRLENLGGELNAFTTKEDTTIHATTLRGDFAKAAELIEDIVFNSTFPEHEVEREKQVVEDEINSYLDVPQEMLYDDFEARMFGGSALGRNILGTTDSVAALKCVDLQTFVRRTYTPDQMVFSAIGNMSEKSFVAVAERFFGDVGLRRRGFERVVPRAYEPFEESTVRPECHQAHTIMGARAYSLADERRLGLSLVANILGGPAANSRLNTVLRERNGLSYNVEAGYSPFSDTGFAGVYFSCEKDKLARCRSLVEGELKRIVDAPLTPRALSMAKKQFIGQFLISMESSESYMMGAAKSMLVHGEIDSPAVARRKVEAITAEELLAIAREVFGGPLSTVTFR